MQCVIVSSFPEFNTTYISHLLYLLKEEDAKPDFHLQYRTVFSPVLEASVS